MTDQTQTSYIHVIILLNLACLSRCISYTLYLHHVQILHRASSILAADRSSPVLKVGMGVRETEELQIYSYSSKWLGSLVHCREIIRFNWINLSHKCISYYWPYMVSEGYKNVIFFPGKTSGYDNVFACLSPDFLEGFGGSVGGVGGGGELLLFLPFRYFFIPTVVCTM